MSYISHAGFLHAHLGEGLGIFFYFSANDGDDFLSLVHGHDTDDFLGLLSLGDGSVHILKDTVHRLRSLGRRACFHAGQHLFYNRSDLCFCHRFSLFSFVKGRLFHLSQYFCNDGCNRCLIGAGAAALAVIAADEIILITGELLVVSAVAAAAAAVAIVLTFV